MTKEDEAALVRRWQEHKDKAALDKLITSNLGVIVVVIREFNRNARKDDDRFHDLFQEGVVGLLTAANRFDPARDVRFCSYATWWIKARLYEALIKAQGQVKFGTKYERLVFFNVRKAWRDLASRGEDPTPAALAKHLHVPEDIVVAMLPRIFRSDVSLDQPVPGGIGDYDNTLHDRVNPISDEGSNPESAVVRRNDNLQIEKLLDFLDERDREIIRRRYFSDDNETLSQIGESFGVTRERVRQLEARALSKLREIATMHGLRP